VSKLTWEKCSLDRARKMGFFYINKKQYHSNLRILAKLTWEKCSLDRARKMGFFYINKKQYHSNLRILVKYHLSKRF
jgi:hypothetical protein